MREKILFIVNETSGTIDKINWIAIATKMLAQRYDLEFKFTTHRGHACELSQKALTEGVKTIVAVGGDGTVNEIASAIIGTDVALGILALGSGNGLARDLGIHSLLPFKALEAIKHRKTMNIDYGLANGVPFFCTCGVGFDAHISFRFAGEKHRGFFRYLILAVKEYFRYTSPKVKIEYDGKQEDREVFVLNCANIKQLGNNAYIAPRADVRDGKLNVTLIKPMGVFAGVRTGLTLFLKQINRIKYTETFECEKLKLELPPETPFHYDGEPIRIGTEVEIEVVKQGLTVIVP